MDPPLPAPRPLDRVLGKQLLFYTPDGPLGGTFTCSRCAALAWQPDLIEHAPGCPYRASPPTPPPVTLG